MTRSWPLACVALAALAGCPEDDECDDPFAVSEDQAEQAVVDVCVTASERCEFEQDTRLAWAQGQTVYVSPVRCAENLSLCLFAVWHEIGHVRLGDNERLADCFAADSAEPYQVDAAVCHFETTTSVDGTADETHGSGSERAARIVDCQQ